MYTRDSTPKASDSSRSFAALTAERFFALDHVGAVKHFEGLELERVVSLTRKILNLRRARFEDATEQIMGRSVYTNVASLQQEGPLTLWITARYVDDVGVILDAKIFHPTDRSAEADELLAHILEELQVALS